MRLEVDLRFDATRAPTHADGQRDRLDLSTLAAEVRKPRRLWRLLRQRRYDEVRVIEGDLPLSAVQATCLVLVAAIPTRRFEVEGRRLGRTAYLLRSLARASVAVPSELGRTVQVARRVSRSADRPAQLPVRAQSARKALYLRVDPTLNWMGMQVGGAATHTAGVINGLIDNGVEVEVLAPERPVGTEGAAYVAVPVRRMLQVVPGLALAEYTQELFAAAEARSADFVYERYQLGSDAGLRIAERLGVPFVLEYNGASLWIERNWGSGDVRLGATLERLERRNLVEASLVVVVSDALKQSAVAEGAPPERVLVNPNGVDIDELAPYRSAKTSEWRARAGLPDEPTVGFIGTFGLWHGVKLLPALAEATPDARWIVIGNGQLFPEVSEEMTARRLDERVFMPGLLSRPRALELLACCDVCVSPHVPNPDGTPFFGSPTKLFEYMGLRKPIVASALGQIGEVLSDEETALLCPPGDVDAAAAAIQRLLADSALSERLATAAFELAASQYTWTAHVRRILDALVAGAVPTTKA